MNIMIIDGIIMLRPIISVNFSFLKERNTLSAKNNVGMPTQAKIYIATLLALSVSAVLITTMPIANKNNMKAIRTAKDYFLVSFLIYLMNSICMLLLLIHELHRLTLYFIIYRSGSIYLFTVVCNIEGS